MKQAPHPIPYQGSKRGLASAILGVVRGRRVRTLLEPFAGSAAITIAAAQARLADRFVIGDSLEPLIQIWNSIIQSPAALAEQYERVWNNQKSAGEDYYNAIRSRYNEHREAADLLYLLARCVKNSPRWNRLGHFNQSPDKRRLGMNPDKMRAQITGAHSLLHTRAHAVAGDFEQTIASATDQDLVYMDPPYEGTSGSRDSRYHQGLARDRLIAALTELNRRRVPWILSYDGRCGDKWYGTPLPAELEACRLELEAGRSSQATLNGESAITIESLYVSAAFGKPKCTGALSLCDEPGQGALSVLETGLGA